MNIITIILGTVLLLYAISTVLGILYNDPYKLTIWLGNIGCGKSSRISQLAIKYLKKGYTVYCNCDDIKLNGVRIYHTYDLGKETPKNAVVLLDEGSLFFDGRNYKATSKEFLTWLRSIRHNKLIVHVFSQNYDMDVKIRRIATSIYIGNKVFNCFTIWRKLKKNIAVKDNAMNAESSIVDELKFVPIWNFSSIRCTFLPRYFKYFNSFKDLTETKPLQYIEVVDGIEKRPQKALKHVKKA